MDPLATLQLLERSIQVHDYAAAAQALTDYFTARLKGMSGPFQGDARAEQLGHILADRLEE